MKRKEPKSPTDIGALAGDTFRRYTAEMIVDLHNEIGLLQRQIESLSESTSDLKRSVTLLTRAVEDVANGKRTLRLPQLEGY